jgi:hypothetical protein
MAALGWPCGHWQAGRWGKINRCWAVRPFAAHGGKSAMFCHYIFGKVKTRDISIANALAFARWTGNSGYYVLSSQNRPAGRLIFVSLSFFLGHLSISLSLLLYLS